MPAILIPLAAERGGNGLMVETAGPAGTGWLAPHGMASCAVVGQQTLYKTRTTAMAMIPVATRAQSEAIRMSSGPALLLLANTATWALYEARRSGWHLFLLRRGL
jgi:hypothetical protein